MRVEIEQCGWGLDSLDEIIKKTINAKAKAAFKHWFYTCKTNQYCTKGSTLSAIKYYAQQLLIKNPKAEISKARFQES